MKTKYNIVYIDPPWKYNSKAHHESKFRGGAVGHYPLMTMREIKELRIPELAADNCALFMWATFPYLDEQIKLFDHWGFKYKTVGFIWIKLNKKGLPFFGVGNYTRSNSEVCLLGIKGSIKPASRKISSVVMTERREHSRKPDEVRKGIVDLFGELPRIEIFARQKFLGWDSIGFDVDGMDIKESLRDILEKEYREERRPPVFIETPPLKFEAVVDSPGDIPEDPKG